MYHCGISYFSTHFSRRIPGVRNGAPLRYNRYAEFAKARVKKIQVQCLGRRGRRGTLSRGGVDRDISGGFHKNMGQYMS